jgi:hypothetical protein
MLALILRALAVWSLIIVVEIIHGICRSVFLAPYTGNFRARQLGVFIGSFLVMLITFSFIKWLRVQTNIQLILIGIFWAILTLLFEFSLGRILGFSWNRILEDYDISRGGFMLFGILTLILSPILCSKIRKK